MFHIPAIFIFYGVAQILHIMCTYYDHKTNIEEHNKHRQHQEKSTKKINELEQIIKDLENGAKKKIEGEVGKEVEKLID